MIKPFETIVFQLFLDMLRASGMALNSQQIDRLRSASQDFSRAFRAEAQISCLNFLKEFQDNVKEAIKEIEDKVNHLDPKFVPGFEPDFGSNATPVVVKPREELTPEDLPKK